MVSFQLPCLIGVDFVDLSLFGGIFHGSTPPFTPVGVSIAFFHAFGWYLEVTRVLLQPSFIGVQSYFIDDLD